MRKIEKAMCRSIWQAIGSGGAAYKWRQSNTSVYTAPAYDGIDCDRYWVFVELHGNRICRIACRLGDISRRVEINSAGWETATTKSRINAICEAFGARIKVEQRDGKWYMRQQSSGNLIWFPTNEWHRV